MQHADAACGTVSKGGAMRHTGQGCVRFGDLWGRFARPAWIGYRVAVLALFLSVGASAQDIYVHVRTGCDDSGVPGTATAPVQTISRALVLATSHTLPLTIWVAGAVS